MKNWVKITLIIVLIALLSYILLNLSNKSCASAYYGRDSQGNCQVVGACSPPKDLILDPSCKEILNNRSDYVVFSKNEVWGPCSRSTVCWQDTYLHLSGKLILNGSTTYQTTLDKTIVDNVINKIEETNIMNIECNDTMVMDYSASYTINYLGNTKTFKNPICQKEFNEIERVMNVSYGPRSGGA